MKQITIALILVIFAGSTFYGQTGVNPDISLIGTFNTFTSLNEGSPTYKKLNFESPSMELFVDGYLNPFARAQGVIAWEDKEFSLEELYAEIVRGLPFDLQLKAGKFLVPFGKLNLQHPHTWPFFDRPLFHQIYFGEEGFNDIGINLNFLVPTGDIFTSVDLGIYKGDAIGKSESADPENDESILQYRGNTPVFSGRLGSFFSVGEFSDIEAGLSGSFGIHTESSHLFNSQIKPVNEENLYYTYLGLDFKYKYRPDSYTALTIQGEGILNRRSVYRTQQLPDLNFIYSKHDITTTGAFLYLDYRFSRQFSTGLKYDFTYGLTNEEPSLYSRSNDDLNTTRGISAWFGYYPVEETLALRLGARHLIFNNKDNNSTENDTQFTLQLLFSLGPHKVHPF